MTKAIALLSGGLDSTLAAKLIMEQGIEVEAINFLTVFCTCTSRGETCLASKAAADKLGIKLKVFEISNEYFNIIKNPKHGYGSNMNPCLDCRIFTFKKAGEYMKEIGASFVITGEVLGQRPMSQRRDAIRIIERDSGLQGLILRPLSAKLFDPTVPEKKGLVDREKLLDFQGRSRKPQIQLAKELNINDYPCPAGGCLLTDPGFANRMRDLIRHKPEFTLNDVKLLKVGRHFRLSPETKLVVGRDKEENRRLSNLAQAGDLSFYPKKIKGPTGIGRGIFDADQLAIASSVVARYSDGGLNRLEIICKQISDQRIEYMTVKPLNEEELCKLRI
jgi:tRNA U34 2-thiouridine synthase MnmA/TrmU